MTQRFAAIVAALSLVLAFAVALARGAAPRRSAR